MKAIFVIRIWNNETNKLENITPAQNRLLEEEFEDMIIKRYPTATVVNERFKYK